MVILISICVYSYFYIDKSCKQTASDIERYRNKTLSSSALEDNWVNQKEKMSIFVNHEFLDKISIYIGQLAVSDSSADNTTFDITYKNILTVLSMIKEEQRFGLHSFY